MKTWLKTLFVGNGLSPSEEPTISQANSKAGFGLFPIREEMMLFTSRAIFGAGEHWQLQAWIKELRESDFLIYNESEEQEAEQGDTADIVGNKRAQSIALTSKRLILSYRKGWLKRKQLAIKIPLKYAVLVQEKKRPKHLEVRFEVPKKGEDMVFFDLWLNGLSNRQFWLDKLRQLIDQNSNSDRSSDRSRSINTERRAR